MTRDRRERPAREAPELEAMIRRMLRSLVTRATEGDLFALEALANLERAMPTMIGDAARGAHTGPAGYSWGEIGRELEITRQAAHQRFGGEDRGPDGG